MIGNKVLLIEDDVAVRALFRDFLQTKGFIVHEADSSRSAQRLFHKVRPDVTVADYELPDGNALELLPRFKAIDPSIPVVIVTAHSSIELAVRAGQEGARHFLSKPVDLSSLYLVLEHVLENRTAGQGEIAEDSLGVSAEINPFLGRSEAIRRLAAIVERVLATENPILVQGETGTGKGVLARWIHASGPRSDFAFVDLNCAGLSGELLETELFGHERGAFTGATSDKVGLLEVAHRGTVFLDEIGDMNAPIQGKLLKVVEEKRFRKLGDVRDHQVDVRLIAASHRDLRTLVQEDRFRSDLYYRLSVFPIRIPSLRERLEDLPALGLDILKRLCADMSRAPVTLTSRALAALQSYSWPGNIRELRNILERAMLLCDKDVLDSSDLILDTHGSGGERETGLTLLEVERKHILRVLDEEQGNVARTALRLGIPRSSLYQKIKKYRTPPAEIGATSVFEFS